jgi:hypothetical protein
MKTSGNNYPLYAGFMIGVPESIWTTRQLLKIYDVREINEEVSE